MSVVSQAAINAVVYDLVLNSPINAIRTVRSLTRASGDNLGLKEAKDVVDKVRKTEQLDESIMKDRLVTELIKCGFIMDADVKFNVKISEQAAVQGDQFTVLVSLMQEQNELLRDLIHLLSE